MSGAEFTDVEIRGKDSVFVLVEATLPPNSSGKPVTVDAKLEFITNGVASEVVLRACGQDVRRLREYVVESDEIFDAALPYQIYDSLVVAQGATLTLAPGATLYFHDKASMIVRGTLLAEGTAEAPVNMTGDRRGNVVTDISFDIMSRQWDGVRFAVSSSGNRLSHTDMRNTERGLAIEGDGAGGEPSLSMLNCLSCITRPELSWKPFTARWRPLAVSLPRAARAWWRSTEAATSSDTVLLPIITFSRLFRVRQWL